MRTPDDFRTRKSDVVIAAFATIGLGWLLSDPMFDEPQAAAYAAPAPKVRPLSQRMHCPAWREGLSRTITITATENEHGALLGVQCHRYKVRNRVAM